MKVVINACFGGFGLSSESERRLMDRCEHHKVFTEAEYTDGRGLNTLYRKYANVLPDGRVLNDKHAYDHAARTCAALVAEVEANAEAAAGNYAKLRVIDIPDGVDFDIDEYDGLESIHETHRSWS